MTKLLLAAGLLALLAGCVTPEQRQQQARQELVGRATDGCRRLWSDPRRLDWDNENNGVVETYQELAKRNGYDSEPAATAWCVPLAVQGYDQQAANQRAEQTYWAYQMLLQPRYFPRSTTCWDYGRYATCNSY